MADSRVQRALSWAALGGLGAGLAVTGYWLLFTTFMVYDDEGYVLLSLRHFSRQGALYDQVYSQYGPFFYLFYDGLHRLLGFEFTNTSGRWLTLVNWLIAAGAGAALVGRVTRSAVWAAFTLALSFGYLWIMINEPMHPGSLVTALIALAAWLGVEAWRAQRRRAFAIGAGVFIAALALTKINVGAFFALAVGFWLAVNAGDGRRPRWIAWALAGGCVLLPFALMHSLFSAPWVRLYGLVFAAGALSLLVTAWRHRQPGAGPWAWTAGTATVSAFLICALLALRGTSVRSLVEGVIVAPLKHPGVYSFGMNWRTGTGLVALLSLGAAAWTGLRNTWTHPGWIRTVAAARILIGAVFVGAAFRLIPTPLAAWGMCYGVSLAWLFAVPLTADGDRGARSWVATLLVFQFLQGYPIAGSQINWGTFLFVPLLACGLHEAFAVFRDDCRRSVRAALILGQLAAVAATLFVAGELARIGWTRYTGSQPLNLAGAKDLRLPDDLRYGLRIAEENLAAHGDVLFSLPGAFSANLWTGLPTPTLANVTHWFSLLSGAQQQQIIDRLATAPRAVLLVQRYHLDYLADHGFSTASPLRDWIADHFEPALAVDSCEVWIRRGRTVAALSTARLVAPRDGRSDKVIVTVRAPAGPVARVEVCDVARPRQPLCVLNGQTARASARPIDLDGRPLGAPAEVAFPLRASGLVELNVQFRGVGAPFGPRSLLVFRGAKGEVLAEARVVSAAGRLR